ncbi:hypothetical protein BH09SUM1_BH09SUM1_22920 [soil metagenome]
MKKLENAFAFYLASVGFACVWVFRLIQLWVVDARSFAAQTPDDAYYYWQIARNVAAGGGSSFDGINLTNGYHPLWLMICAMVAQITSRASDPVTLVHFGKTLIALQLLVAGAGVCMLSVAVKRTLGSGAAALVIACCALPWPVYGMTDGLESGLVLLFLGAFCLCIVQFETATAPASARDVAFGALLSIGFLARLDLAFLIIACGIVAISRGQIKKAICWAAPVATVAGVYFLTTWANFGMLQPISGALKSSFPVPHLKVEYLGQYPGAFAAALVAIAGALACCCVKDECLSDIRFMQLSGAAFVIIHAAYTCLFMKWAVHQWHFTAYWFFAFTGAAILLRPAITKSWLSVGLVSILLLASGAGQWRFFHGRSDRAFQARSYDAALWARDHVPAMRAIGMPDCGAFGYYRGGLVVNLDGVVNSRAYQDTLVREGLALYLSGANVDYIAYHAVPDGEVKRGYGAHRLSAFSHLYEKEGGAVTLNERDEIYRSDVYNDGNGPRRFMIWKLEPTSPRSRTVVPR